MLKRIAVRDVWTIGEDFIKERVVDKRSRVGGHFQMQTVKVLILNESSNGIQVNIKFCALGERVLAFSFAK